MTFYLLCKASLFLFLLHVIPRSDGGTILEVRQPELMTAEAGESVNITCSFELNSPSFTAKWTRGCKHSVSLGDQTCYNGRINGSDGEPINITTDSGTVCCERYSILTIVNVTENDSGTYCCHITSARGQKGAGPGTRLEVTPITGTGRAVDPEETQTFILYCVVGAETCIILVLLIVGLKYCLKGSSKTENKVFEVELEHEPKLHYAEICPPNRQKRARVKHTEQRVTYASVKMRQ